LDLSFIIVNYNTPLLVEECIDSLLENSSLKNNMKFEVIVIDNKSKDDSVYFLSEKYINHKNIIIVDSGENNGFGKGNNLGAFYSKGKYLCCINSDTISKKTDYQKLLNELERNKEIGLLGTKVLNKDGSIQSLGFNNPSVKNDFLLSFLFWNFNFMKKIRYRSYKNKGLFNVDWVSGCFFLVLKENFEKVNGFDEKIFMYSEDLDLSIRINNIGLKNFVLDTTEIYHLHGGSTNKKKLSLRKMLKEKNNYFYVIKKNNLLNYVEILLIKSFTKIHVLMLYILKNTLRKIKVEN